MTGVNGRTPLGWLQRQAMLHNWHLLKAGADPDKTGLRREVPLIRAARNGHLRL